MFLAKGIYRHCEIDNYKEGCQPNTGYAIEWSVNFQSNTMEGLLQEIKDYHNVDDEALEIELGEINIQSYEIPLYDRWITPTENHIKAWKKGEQEIYLVNYCYRLFKGM